MKKIFPIALIVISLTVTVSFIQLQAQDKIKLAPLSLEEIMRDPQWIGSSPSQAFWSPNGDNLYFFWNLTGAPADSLYVISMRDHQPHRTSYKEAREALAQRYGSWNSDRSKLVYIEGNALKVLDLQSGKINLLLKTQKHISKPKFAFFDTHVVYREGNNLYAIRLKGGTTIQLTDFRKGKAPTDPKPTAREIFLHEDALENSSILRKRDKEQEQREENYERHKELKDEPLPIYLEGKKLVNLSISPDGNYILYQLMEKAEAEKTIVPNYVTKSGYIEDLPARPKVGSKQASFHNYVYDMRRDSAYEIDTEQIPGIRDIPSYIKKNYPDKYKTLKKNPPMRSVYFSAPQWNKKNSAVFYVIRALDHKDRWIMLLDPEKGKLKLLDRQHDDAWIGGPGIGYPYSLGNVGWLDGHTVWFQSEESGYSHLYTSDIKSGKTRMLTRGDYEVLDAQLSSTEPGLFYLTTNAVEPGQMQFYHIDVASGKQVRITTMEGGNDVVVSPDEEHIAIRFSTAVHPWELYLKANKPDAEAERITHKAESAEYQSYPWRKPEIITFTDRDGYEVYASVYKPEDQASTRPGVIFVHGAGYLQDVKKYWSYYFREHMFINLLVDQGYTVMDIDYRGSAGYGRDWRTAIYRHMGGNDLEDIVDGARYMVKELNVNPDKIGIWGGSYGGFMTLMALFKTDVFACGAALRSVADWAHYNHAYTSDILNTPQSDSIAYVQSSPIYYAEGLNEELLMCHGMLDRNVHFQDIVRVSQKLIELGKENWELAVYPLEGHGFTESSSWTDEYKRIYRLFQENLMPLGQDNR